MELTTKAGAIFRKPKYLGGFCVSSFLALDERRLRRRDELRGGSEGDQGGGSGTHLDL